MTAPSPYIGLAVHLIVCIVLGVGLLAAAAVLRYRVATKPRSAKNDTYECGEEPLMGAWKRIPVGFYLVALMFILFDVEAAFLFLWVASLKSVGAAAFWAMVVFLAVLLLGWAYAFRKGDLNWSR
jgi:NADH-quinone oxidoreductase subunit A